MFLRKYRQRKREEEAQYVADRAYWHEVLVWGPIKRMLDKVPPKELVINNQEHMPNYCCNNEQCKDFRVIRNESQVSVFYDKTLEKTVDTGETCPVCGELRTQIRDKDAGMTTTMLGSENICKK